MLQLLGNFDLYIFALLKTRGYSEKVLEDPDLMFTLALDKWLITASNYSPFVQSLSINIFSFFSNFSKIFVCLFLLDLEKFVVVVVAVRVVVVIKLLGPPLDFLVIFVDIFRSTPICYPLTCMLSKESNSEWLGEISGRLSDFKVGKVSLTGFYYVFFCLRNKNYGVPNYKGVYLC